MTVIHVIESDDGALEQPETQSLPRAVAHSSTLLREELSAIEGLNSAVVVRRGRPIVEINEIALWDKTDLIVTGISRNEVDGRSLLGSTTTSLLRESGLPVLVVKKKPDDTRDRIVAAIDLSPAASGVFETAVRFFQPESLVVFHAFEPPFKNWVGDKEAYSRQLSKDAVKQIRNLSEQFKHDHGVHNIQIVTFEGDPARQLAVYVDENDIGLVVAGTDGRHAIMNLFVESVAGQILHEVQCDILIVPSHAQN
ncbi:MULTISPECIES: universal stress protein [Rhizobiaceae]